MSKTALFFALVFPVMFLVACDQDDSRNDQVNTVDGERLKAKVQVPVRTSVLDQVRQRDTLRVVTRNAPTSYYLGINGEAGFEYEMVSDFALFLGVGVEFVVRDDVGAILQVLRDGEADLAAAGLTHTGRREKDFLFGPGYQHIRQQVVCRRGGKQAVSLDELSSVVLAVVSQSSYEERLRDLVKLVPDLDWDSVGDTSDEELLEKVVSREVDCSVADSNIVAVNRRYHPELEVMFDLSEPQELAWAMLPEATELHEKIEDWFAGYWSDGQVQRLTEVYYGYIDNFDYVDTHALLRRMRSRLPDYRPLFEQAAEEYGFPWPLLAAQAYQESHWDEKATSPTGVRGLMMLTRATAEELGVSDRTDPEQVINAGARYLSRLRNRLPESVAEPDRTWMALAAYNMGMSHVWDARSLARKEGLDADEWNSMKQVLPLMSQRHYYRSLKAGYARGYEALSYVQRIRNYYDMVNMVLVEGEL